MSLMGDRVAQAIAGAADVHTPEALRDAVDVCAAAGYDELILVPTTADPDELTRTRDALGI